jgi:methyltransferase (TIGR00027 family)
MIRAWESRRADRLFDDRVAEAFVDAVPGAFPEEPAPGELPAALTLLGPLGATFYLHVAVRTRFFDEYLIDAVNAGCQQVVLLAAGLDARAFRLPWPAGTRIFEIDFPAVLDFKDDVLTELGATPRCQRTVVPADLRTAWPVTLADAGFDHDIPTAWLAEGLLVYLTADEAARLLADVTTLSAPGSHLAFEHLPTFVAAVVDRALALPTLRPYAKLWKGGLGDETPSRLAGNGWRTEFHGLSDLAASYQRSFSGESPGGFLTATRLPSSGSPSNGPATWHLRGMKVGLGL